MSLSWDYSESNLSEMLHGSQELDFGSLPLSHAIIKPKSKTTCKFFLAGKCSFGTRCQFSHILRAETCSFFRAGHCKYGSSCSLKHETRELEFNEMTFSMGKLDFEPTLPTLIRNEGRNSLLPSFLVDELLLDDDEHQPHPHSNSHKRENEEPEISPHKSLFSSSLEEESSVVFSEREYSTCSSVVKSCKPPNSYGEAISSGLNLPQPQNISDFSTTTNSTSLSRSQSPTASNLDDLCAFSIMGKCRYGTFCRNVHGLQCPRCLMYVLHPTDMEKNEDHLNECLSKPESVTISELHQIPCGLCHSPILQGVDPRFGLLNCNHAFCLSCIRTWRSSHFDANSDYSRSCPDCSEVTYFIVPSSTWIDDHVEKFKVIEQYKKRMSVIPCKYFDYGRGECPFSSSCFYDHQTDGTDKFGSFRPALILDHREQIAKVRETKLSDYIIFKTAPARNKKK